ncbi:hypothetical protein [Pseudomonas aeruginosa]|uniref:hypothetical protein n=1 Tax=Pseudomonas aeruginosa TaxID=287 RepID=UPI000FC4298E|nr:hypothetical protein [Pseudomonas aeruginosa]RUE82323.1 hypothetical protein IPC1150_28010 [Pseudomonas aeruginosa]
MEAASTQAPARASWTFADLASTYPFWALIVATVAVTFGALAIEIVLMWLPYHNELSPDGHTLYVTSQVTGSVAGVALGLLLAYARRVKGLLVTIATCVLVCTVLAIFGGRANWEIISLTTFISRAAATAVAFAVVVYLSGAAADRLAFAGGLAVATIAIAQANTLGGAVSGMLMTRFSATGCYVAGLAALALALLLLAPIRGALFESSPVPRHRPLKPTLRTGSTVAIVAALPWLAVAGLGLLSAIWIGRLFGAAAIVIGLAATAYWLYRLYGEVASLYPSQKLFTPVGALLMYLLVPVALPILLLCLGGVLREARAQRGQPVRSAAGFNVWCIVFPPIALAMVQKTLNDLADLRDRRES